MSLIEGFVWGVLVMVIGSAGLVVLALWVRVQDEQRQEKEAHTAKCEAFRKAFTIHPY